MKGFDYASARAYFVTACIQNRLCLLGDIRNEEVFLTEAGFMVDVRLRGLELKFSMMYLTEYVIMPNHVHAIIEIDTPTSNLPVGADPCVGPNDHKVSIPEIIQWFKTMTTNDYLRGVKEQKWQPFEGKLWQRGYHDHIIRNEDGYGTIVSYIRENPKKWAEDSLFQAR